MKLADAPEVKIDSQLVIKSIGYASTQMPGVPFNERTKTIPHDFGCVIDPSDNNKHLTGLYVCGWAKRGPVGIIDATLRDTKETFGVLRHHIETDQLVEKNTSVDDVYNILGSNKSQTLSFDEWLKVDAVEKARGETLEKVREKILSTKEMIDIAKN